MNKWIYPSLLVAALVFSQSASAATFKCDGPSGVTFRDTPCEVKAVESSPIIRAQSNDELLEEIQASYLAAREASKAAVEQKQPKENPSAEGRRRMAERLALASACVKHERDCNINEFASALRFMNLGQVEAILGKGKSVIKIVEYFSYRLTLKVGGKVTTSRLEIFYQLPKSNVPNEERPVYEMTCYGERT